MKRMILISLSIAAIFASGCSTTSQSSCCAPTSASSTPPKTTAIEGSWTGHEVTPGREGPASLLVSGHTLEFHGADSSDWLKGAFVLLENTNPKQCVGNITECPAADYVGKFVYCIYKIENGKLTITGNEPGDSNAPASFDASGARQFVFELDQ